MGNEKIQISAQAKNPCGEMVKESVFAESWLICSLEVLELGGWITRAVWVERLTYGSVRSWGLRYPRFTRPIAETFFHTLKTELVYDHRYKTREEAKNSIFNYIETYYNKTRIHSSIGYLAPMELEYKNTQVSV